MGKGREKVEQIIWRLIGRLRRFLDVEILIHNRLDFTRCFEIVLVKENIGVPSISIPEPRRITKLHILAKALALRLRLLMVGRVTPVCKSFPYRT
jgi:hypothetical protein